jgi:hypothetical protein
MTLTPLTEYRQSLLRGSTVCMLRTMKTLTVPENLPLGWVEHYGDLGTAWHAYMKTYFETLATQGEVQMPTQEAVEILYETLVQMPFSLPVDAMDDLRGMALGFCDHKWNPRMLKSAVFEEDIRAGVPCLDGVTRVLKGTPDVLMFDPPHSLLIIDAKSGRGRPKGPRIEPEAGEIVEERKWLSDMFQGDTYSLLGLYAYPSVQRVTFREYHLRSGQVRQSTLSREQLEHVERKLAVLMMQLDRAISEGEDSALWRPRPGSHCARQCPVARSCPIPQEMRGDGAMVSQEDADAGAGRLSVLEGERKALIGQLKAWGEDPMHSLPAANEDEVAGWKPPQGKGRKFGLWKRDDLTDEETAA